MVKLPPKNQLILIVSVAVVLVTSATVFGLMRKNDSKNTSSSLSIVSSLVFQSSSSSSFSSGFSSISSVVSSVEQSSSLVSSITRSEEEKVVAPNPVPPSPLPIAPTPQPQPQPVLTPIPTPPPPVVPPPPVPVSSQPPVNKTISKTITYSTPGGPHTVKFDLFISNGEVSTTSASYISGATPQYINIFSSGSYNELVGKDLNKVNSVFVSGASLTSKAFNDALLDLKAQL
jgi:hypothetical protein